MKAATAVCLVALLAACSGLSPTESNTSTVTLRFHDTTTVSGTAITFADINDSRCPANVVCVWEGDAAVRLDWNGNPTVLHTSQSAGPQSARIDAVTVTLLDVTPKRQTSDEPQKSVYMVTLRVTH